MLLKKICIGKILTSKVRPLDQHLKDHFIKDEVEKKRSLRCDFLHFSHMAQCLLLNLFNLHT